MEHQGEAEGEEGTLDNENYDLNDSLGACPACNGWIPSCGAGADGTAGEGAELCMMDIFGEIGVLQTIRGHTPHVRSHYCQMTQLTARSRQSMQMRWQWVIRQRWQTQMARAYYRRRERDGEQSQPLSSEATLKTPSTRQTALFSQPQASGSERETPTAVSLVTITM